MESPEQFTGWKYKRSKVCICGGSKIKGTPFCGNCWKHVPEEFRERLRLAKGDTYNVVFESIVTYLRFHELIP